MKLFHSDIRRIVIDRTRERDTPRILGKHERGTKAAKNNFGGDGRQHQAEQVQENPVHCIPLKEWVHAACACLVLGLTMT